MNKIEKSSVHQNQASKNRRPSQNGTRPNNQKKPSSKSPSSKNNSSDIMLIVGIVVVGIIILTLVVLGFRALIGATVPKTDEEESEVSQNTSVLGEYAHLKTMEFAEQVSRRDVAPYLPTPTPSPANEISIEGKEVEQFGGMITVGEWGFEYYKYDQTYADMFVTAMNQSIAKIDPDVNVFTMIVPSSIDVVLPLHFLEQYDEETSDQHKTIQYLGSKLDENALHLDIYPMMKAHCDENIYMKRHPIWTSLGAYYASSTFKSAKGFETPQITSYRKGSAGEYTGYISRYLQTDNVKAPEAVEYYIPGSSLVLTDPEVFEEPDEVVGTTIFKDVGQDTNKLNVFLGGTNDITEITNKSNVNGGTIVILGDTYAYELAPYIAEDYYKTYLIDYREYSGDLSQFVQTMGATDLLYCIKIGATISDTLISEID